MRDTKVRQQRPARACFEKDVFRLDVAMDNTMRMRKRERLRNFPENAFRALWSEWTLVGDRLLERAAWHQLHHQREPAVAQPMHGVNSHDVGMLQSRDRSRFARQACYGFLSARRETWSHHFDGHFAMERAVPCAIHDGATAASQLPEQRIGVLKVADFACVTIVTLIDHRASCCAT